MGLGFKTPREAMEGEEPLQTLAHHMRSPWAPMPDELWQGAGSLLTVVQAILAKLTQHWLCRHIH